MLESEESAGNCRACRNRNSDITKASRAVRTGCIVENLMAIESREQHTSVGLKMEARASNVKNGILWVIASPTQAVAWFDPGNYEKCRGHARKLELKRVMPFWGSHHHVVR